MRELTYADIEELAQYYTVRGRIERIRSELHQRDVLGNEEHSAFMFGIRRGEELVGIAYGRLQRAHGFVVNNCIETDLRPDGESEELYRYVYAYVTSEALARGAPPIDNLQYEGSTRRSGKFPSTELGYETVTAACRLVK